MSIPTGFTCGDCRNYRNGPWARRIPGIGYCAYEQFNRQLIYRDNREAPKWCGAASPKQESKAKSKEENTMEIPMNDKTADEALRVEATVKAALEKLNGGYDFTMCWADYPKWLADRVTSMFVEKGYHASRTHNMRGNTGSWFWYCNTISKSPISETSLPKSRRSVIA